MRQWPSLGLYLLLCKPSAPGGAGAWHSRSHQAKRKPLGTDGSCGLWLPVPGAQRQTGASRCQGGYLDAWAPRQQMLPINFHATGSTEGGGWGRPLRRLRGGTASENEHHYPVTASSSIPRARNSTAGAQKTHLN